MNSRQAASQPGGVLANKVALVTGATGGLGASICQRIATDGGSLVITDLDIDECTRLAETLPGGLTRHRVVALQVEEEAQWTAAVSEVTEHFGELHILVNNAGIGSIADVEDETREIWDRLVAIDQTGVWLGMKHCGPLIERSGGGSIINMCSILGTVGGMGNSIAYHAAKGAVRTMTKSAALHWAASGVRVNSLHPGFIESVHDRVRELLEHHDRRLAHTLAVLRSGGRSMAAHEVASALTWTRRQVSFDSLDPFNAMIAICETMAHLDLLVATGRAVVDSVGDVDLFSPQD